MRETALAAELRMIRHRNRLRVRISWASKAGDTRLAEELRRELRDEMLLATDGETEE